MGKINYGRVVLGGLVAGLIINVGEFILNEPILRKDWDAVMQSLNRPAVGGGAIAVFVTLAFLLGIMIVWIYAAMRPRMGAGPKTAVCAGLVVWALVYLYTGVGNVAAGIFPSRLVVIGVVWGFFEMPLGALVGAWLYKESEG